MSSAKRKVPQDDELTIDANCDTCRRVGRGRLFNVASNAHACCCKRCRSRRCFPRHCDDIQRSIEGQESGPGCGQTVEEKRAIGRRTKWAECQSRSATQAVACRPHHHPGWSRSRSGGPSAPFAAATAAKYMYWASLSPAGSLSQLEHFRARSRPHFAQKGQHHQGA